ncbi:G-type lectin S-receptor-like serine/threonine-protein kinase At1g61480 isoform X1 [Humulus lupulus]|uniref:G-type lectin S-receptor-like serine/threonine-protein kinase At1g61480 isoform X1 n=1 Tax=Humulus lupulus TaxID=3486 RepID=UPI002B414AF1|nr:G-type lectin S-receptor-like serine/threonine-protein kinase At1g61480 isoform X1 [Humulus lupulus]
MSPKYRDCSLCLLLVFYMFQSRYCSEIYNISSSQSLSKGQTLVSSNQVLELGFFSPNNSANQYVGIWYKGISPRTVVWVANRENPVRLADAARTSLMIGRNGNLGLVDANNNSVIWSTDVHVRSNSSIVELSDRGNLVLKDGASGEHLWQSFDHPADTFLPGSVLGYNVKTGESYVLTSWKSDNDPSSGSFTLEISKQSPPQIFIWINGSKPHWRSGPWDKSKFIGIPEADTSYHSSTNLEQELYKGTTFLYLNLYNDSIITKVFVTSKGNLKSLIKVKGSDSWETDWEAPRNQCDIYGTCGPFGVCKTSRSPICRCLEGFVPKSDKEWRNGNWTGGCKRRTELHCEKNTSGNAVKGGKKDEFLKIGLLKLPDLHEYVIVDDDKGCYKWCLNNCSCLAYTFVNGIGCLVWWEDLVDIQELSFGGFDLFLRLSDTELVRGKKTKRIIISITAISGSALLLASVFALHRQRANKKSYTMRGCFKNPSGKDKISKVFDFNENGNTPMHTRSAELYDDSLEAELHIFNLDGILTATNHFSLTNKLGEGGFGSVYKGKLEDGKEIAVKRLSRSSGQGIEELKNEAVLISKLQHRNLVKLLGYCIQNEEKLLVYEFMPNRSLDTFIFDPTRSAQLDWPTRFNIIHGVSRGLVYLHRDSNLRVIHRDLKVSNILLDENMNPKISDFGLARIFEGTLDRVNTVRVVGTLGYMSPEYAIAGIFSEKSDVFSFGVMLLEIVNGRKNTSFDYYEQQPSLIAYAWQLWSESKGLDLVDGALVGSLNASEAMRCIHVGLLCVQDHAADRPTMVDVVFMLTNETDRPQPKQPIFTFQREHQPQNKTKSSLNDATVSLLEGR